MLRHYIIVFFISMLPLVEIRGAMPYAVGFDLPLIPSIIVAIVGNICNFCIFIIKNIYCKV